jgi:hypothetical protein
MFWNDIIRTLGGMAILVAALAWIAKALLTTLLSKDLEQFKSSLKIEAQRRSIEFSNLHAKRAELIADLYSRMMLLHKGILSLTMEMGRREVRVKEHKKKRANANEVWRIQVGIHTLSSREEEIAIALQNASRDFFNFYTEKKIYFSHEICDQIDSFAALAGYMAMMYQNVAIKDEDGQLLVDPVVAEFWEKAWNRFPQLQASLETEFRLLLGVKVTNEKDPPRRHKEAVTD